MVYQIGFFDLLIIGPLPMLIFTNTGSVNFRILLKKIIVNLRLGIAVLY